MRELTISELLAEDPTYPAWLKRNTLIPPVWKTCCHEAAHCVAALKLLGTPVVRAYIFAGRDGATLVPPSTGLNRAILIAAGDAGEMLALRNPSPPGEPHYFDCEFAAEDADAAPNDNARLKDWFAKRGECAPSRKSIRRRASEFVWKHQQEILTIATWLHSHGSGEFSFRDGAAYRTENLTC